MRKLTILEEVDWLAAWINGYTKQLMMQACMYDVHTYNVLYNPDHLRVKLRPIIDNCIVEKTVYFGFRWAQKFCCNVLKCSKNVLYIGVNDNMTWT